MRACRRQAVVARERICFAHLLIVALVVGLPDIPARRRIGLRTGNAALALAGVRTRH